MKRLTLPAILCSSLALCVAFSGCAEEAKVKQEETVTTPGGSTTTTIEKKIESSGSNPPSSSEGAKVDSSTGTTPAPTDTTPK